MSKSEPIVVAVGMMGDGFSIDHTIADPHGGHVYSFNLPSWLFVHVPHGQTLEDYRGCTVYGVLERNPPYTTLRIQGISRQTNATSLVSLAARYLAYLPEE